MHKTGETMEGMSDFLFYELLFHVMIPFLSVGAAFFCAYIFFNIWARRHRTKEWFKTANLKIMVFFGGIFVLFLILLVFSSRFGITIPYESASFYAQIGGFTGWSFAHALFKSWRKTLMIIAAPFLVVLLPLLFLEYIYTPWPRMEDCVSYTKMLNGGMHRFGDQDYNITLCVAEGRDSDDIRLLIHSMDGKLLVERFYEATLSNNNHTLTYYNDRITTFSNGTNGYEKIVIKMPPTWLDRFRASFPLIRPKEE
jgi:hypothetical protein